MNVARSAGLQSLIRRAARIALKEHVRRFAVKALICAAAKRRFEFSVEDAGDLIIATPACPSARSSVKLMTISHRKGGGETKRR